VPGASDRALEIHRRFPLTRVLIVDDHEVVRRGVRSLLAARTEFDVCGEAVDGQDGVEKAKQLRPDVVVMDISMPKLNGFEATRLIRNLLPDIGVLILSQHGSPEAIKQAFRAGARGYVMKSSIADQLESAVEAVSRGDEFVAALPNFASHPQDLTESKHAKQERSGRAANVDWRENQELLRAAFAQTYSLLAMLSVDGTIFEANRAALEGTGFSRGEVLGRKLWDVWWHSLPEEQAIAKTSVETAARGLTVREECEYMLRDGTIRFADRTLNPVQNERGDVVMIVLSGLDITEHRQLRSMLEDRVHERTGELEMKNLELMRHAEVVRELSARLLQIQDEERRRIARELHDSVGQMLAAVNMNIAQVNRELDALSPESAKAMTDNEGLLEEISREIRTISHLLHPPLLDEVGLQSALEWYIDGFSERSKINVNLELPTDFGRLPRNLEITLFRVVQECLTNIHRHSGSSTAAVRVARSENEVRLEVRDAGKGIPAETQTTLASGKLSGVGLRGMSERLRQMGGQLEVHSNGTGTLVTATLPIEIVSAKEAAAAARPRDTK
jgi:PAS domain S-box-containing protein